MNSWKEKSEIRKGKLSVQSWWLLRKGTSRLRRQIGKRQPVKQLEILIWDDNLELEDFGNLNCLIELKSPSHWRWRFLLGSSKTPHFWQHLIGKLTTRRRLFNYLASERIPIFGFALHHTFEICFWKNTHLEQSFPNTSFLWQILVENSWQRAINSDLGIWASCKECVHQNLHFAKSLPIQSEWGSIPTWISTAIFRKFRSSLWLVLVIGFKKGEFTIAPYP